MNITVRYCTRTVGHSETFNALFSLLTPIKASPHQALKAQLSQSNYSTSFMSDHFILRLSVLKSLRFSKSGHTWARTDHLKHPRQTHHPCPVVITTRQTLSTISHTKTSEYSTIPNTSAFSWPCPTSAKLLSRPDASVKALKRPAFLAPLKTWKLHWKRSSI